MYLPTFAKDFPPHVALRELYLDLGFWELYIRRGGYYNIASSCEHLVRRVLSRLPSLRKLCLSRWITLTEADVSAIVICCPHLEELRLAGLDVGSAHSVVTRAESPSFRSRLDG